MGKTVMEDGRTFCASFIRWLDRLAVRYEIEAVWGRLDLGCRQAHGKSAGHEADSQVATQSGEEMFHSGRKVTASILKEI